jgi:ankyrin repeat protein
VNQAADDDETPLYIAAREGREPVVRLLLENGAAVNQATVDEMTPMHIAVSMGHMGVAHALLGE